MCCDRRRAERWRCSRPACSGLSISERRAREHDVGADREPESVIAHDRYLDEHAKDREDYHNERSNKPKVHCAYLLGLVSSQAQGDVVA
jgi:hypothetical protein